MPRIRPTFCICTPRRTSRSCHGASSSFLPLSAPSSLFTSNTWYTASPPPPLLQPQVFRHFSSDSSSRASNTPQSRRPMSPFLKRTEAVKKILDLFSSLSVWNGEETPCALNELSVVFHSYTVSEVIRRSADLDIALSFFNWLIGPENHFEADSYVYNSLVYRLGKSGRLKEMQAMADLSVTKGKASAATFTSLIAGYKKAMETRKALDAWNQMKELGFKPCHKAYTVMIDLYASVKMYEEAGGYYLQILNDGLRPSIKTYTVLMNHLIREGKLDAAVDMFQELLKVKLRPNPVTCMHLMLGYAKVGDMSSVLKLVRDFKGHGHSPGALGSSFISVLKYLVSEGRIEDAEKIMREGWPEASDDEREKKIVELRAGGSCDKNVVYGHAFVSRGESMAEKGEESRDTPWIDDGRDEQDEEEEEEDEDDDADDGSRKRPYPHRSGEDSTLLNVAAFVRCLYPWTNATVRALQRSNLRFDHRFVSKVLNRLSRADLGWKFYCWVPKQQQLPGFSHDRYTCHAMIELFLRDRGFRKAKRLLVEAHQEHVAPLPLRTYAILLKHCGLQKDSVSALEVFEILKESGLLPDESCYRYLVHALFKCGRYWRVATTCFEMEKAGFLLDGTMYSLLISGFVTAGRLSPAKKLLKRMRAVASSLKPDVYVYNALMRTYDRKGKPEKARRIYDAMRNDGIKPSSQTYELMIDILSRTGDCDRASALRDEMKRKVSVNGKTAKKARIDRYLHFHSLFVGNLVGGDVVENTWRSG